MRDWTLDERSSRADLTERFAQLTRATHEKYDNLARVAHWNHEEPERGAQFACSTHEQPQQGG